MTLETSANRENRATLASLFLLLWLPLLFAIAQPDPAVSVNEQRMLTALPELGLDSTYGHPLPTLYR